MPEVLLSARQAFACVRQQLIINIALACTSEQCIAVTSIVCQAAVKRNEWLTWLELSCMEAMKGPADDATLMKTVIPAAPKPRHSHAAALRKCGYFAKPELRPARNVVLKSCGRRNFVVIMTKVS